MFEFLAITCGAYVGVSLALMFNRRDAEDNADGNAASDNGPCDEFLDFCEETSHWYCRAIFKTKKRGWRIETYSFEHFTDEEMDEFVDGIVDQPDFRAVFARNRLVQAAIKIENAWKRFKARPPAGDGPGIPLDAHM